MLYPLSDQPDTSPEEDDLFEHHRFTVDAGQSLMRIDKYLGSHLKNYSRSKIQQAIETESVSVNGSFVKASYKVKPLDEIVISFAHPPREDYDVIAQDIPLNIVYEDDAVLIVNKAHEMVVHPGHGNPDGTLVNALVHHFGQLPSMESNVSRPGLVHRIDKGTSGLLVIAKTEYAMQYLAKQFANHTTKRTYYALIWGEPKDDQGTINAHIGRSYKDRRLCDVFPDGSYGREAITHYKVLKRLRYISLIQCNLETGRTHQIRAHMKYLGHPLFGDPSYGGDKVLRGQIFSKYKQFVDNCFTILPRQALHAKTLGFEHPTTKEWMQFDSELPADFQQVLEKWEHYLQFN